MTPALAAPPPSAWKSPALATPSCGPDFDVALHDRCSCLRVVAEIGGDAPRDGKWPHGHIGVTRRQRPARQRSARERRHVERLHVRGIAVLGAIGTGVAVEAAAVAAWRAVRPADMAETILVREPGRRNTRRPDRLSGKVFRHIGRTGESPREALQPKSQRRTATRRDRHATARIADASGCRAATVSALRRAWPIAGTADKAGRTATPRAHRIFRPPRR